MYIKLVRALVCIAIIGLFLFIVYSYFNQAIEIEIKHNCEKVEQTDDYCVFNCSFYSDEMVKGRIIVTHTVWASIFEEDFVLKSNYSTLIKLPRRNFKYWLRAGFYNLKNNKIYKYGMLEDWLYC